MFTEPCRCLHSSVYQEQLDELRASHSGRGPQGHQELGANRNVVHLLLLGFWKFCGVSRFVAVAGFPLSSRVEVLHRQVPRLGFFFVVFKLFYLYTNHGEKVADKNVL